VNGEHAVIDITQEQRRLGPLGATLWRGGLTFGSVAAAVSIALGFGMSGRADSFFFAYLVNYAFFLSVALGALFFVLVLHVTHAGWGVVARRLAEGVTATFPWLAVLFIPILLGTHVLYHWADPSAVASDAALRWKAPYLNAGFFVARWVVYFGVWIAMSRSFMRDSLTQDRSGDPQLTVRMQRRAAVGLFLFAFTSTFAAIDLLMSLDGHWYSTIFGVYYFAGGVVGCFAVLVIIAVGLQRAGLLRRTITREHYHDLGKLLFAFVVFWAYIAFSQYMLIWYGNMPEETHWYLARQSNGWGWVAVVLIFGHFLLPFLMLLSRAPKRRKRLLVVGAAWLVTMHWIDISWVVLPAHGSGSALFDPINLTLFAAFAGLMLARFAQALRPHSLVAERDPRLAESLTFENA